MLLLMLLMLMLMMQGLLSILPKLLHSFCAAAISDIAVSIYLFYFYFNENAFLLNYESHVAISRTFMLSFLFNWDQQLIFPIDIYCWSLIFATCIYCQSYVLYFLLLLISVVDVGGTSAISDV